MMKSGFVARGLTAIALVAGATGAAQAEVGPAFSCLSLNSAYNCSVGEQQFQLSFTQSLDSKTVEFTFTNLGPVASSITDIYFDWADPAPSIQSKSITNSAGVSFGWGANPSDLPNGLAPDFTANLSADSNSRPGGVQANGVNPNEWVSFKFLLDPGYVGNVGDDLFSGDLKIGIHAQAFPDGGSEWFVSHAAPVPEPGAVALMLAGLGAVGFAARRRRSGSGAA